MLCYEKKTFQFLMFILKMHMLKKKYIIIIMLIYILYNLITRYYFLTSYFFNIVRYKESMVKKKNVIYPDISCLSSA